MGDAKTLEETQNNEYRSQKADLPQGSQELCTVSWIKKVCSEGLRVWGNMVPRASNVPVIISFLKKSK